MRSWLMESSVELWGVWRPHKAHTHTTHSPLTLPIVSQDCLPQTDQCCPHSLSIARWAYAKFCLPLPRRHSIQLRIGVKAGMMSFQNTVGANQTLRKLCHLLFGRSIEWHRSAVNWKLQRSFFLPEMHARQREREREREQARPSERGGQEKENAKTSKQATTLWSC